MKMHRGVKAASGGSPFDTIETSRESREEEITGRGQTPLPLALVPGAGLFLALSIGNVT